MSEIILTEAQKKEDLASRVKVFQEGFKKLQEETKLRLVPRIYPDGPVLDLEDTKYEDTTPKQ